MKSKLLKKIRKRFTIFEVTLIPSHASDWERRHYKRLGLPFHYIHDALDSTYWLNNENTFKTLQECKDAITSHAIYIWGPKYRYKPGKESKVWHNK